jgi:hypothetical protein
MSSRSPAKRCGFLDNKCGAEITRWSRIIMFLDRTVAVRRHEKPDAIATGMIPGNRGMGRDSWCRVSLPKRTDETARGQAYITSSSGRSRVRPVHESGTVRQSAIRNRAEPSQAHRTFRLVRRRSYPEVMVATAKTRTRSCCPAPTLPEGPARESWARKDSVTAGSERTWQSPSTSIGAA